MPSSAQTATLVANTVATFTLDKDYPRVEVALIDNPALAWCRADGQNPVAMADGSVPLPAALSFVHVYPKTSTATVVKVISAGTPTVSVRGLPL